MLDALTRYQEWGLCTFPLIYRSKKPAVKWEEFQKRKPTGEEIGQWFSTNSTNVAIVCGAISGNFGVLDFDDEDLFLAVAAYWKQAFGESITDSTPVVRTGRGGYHVYLKFREMPPLYHPIREQRKYTPDIQGEGGYVVAPPSVHPAQLEIEIPKHNAQAAKGAPDKIKDGGGRNVHLTSLAGSMRRRDMSQQAILAALEQENAIRCDPPLPDNEVADIARSISRYEPSAPAIPADDGNQVECNIRVFRMSEVQPEPVVWLWDPYIPLKKPTLLEGDPGIGKSWVCLAIATAVSTGRGLPGGGSREPQGVLIASAEDGLGDTLRPRLEAMGASLGLIYAIDGPLSLDATGFNLLEQYMVCYTPSLVIIDPLVAYIGANVDIHRANETRQVLAQLARLADQHNAAILAVRHLTKGSTLKPIYRGVGSIDFTAACRSVLLAGCEADNPQNRVIVHIKSNLAMPGPSIGYELRQDGFFWTGESTLTAGDVLAGEGEPSAMEEAMGFLLAELTGSSMPAKQVFKDAKDSGISEVTLRRAKFKLGVIAERIGGSGGSWYWRLPGEQGGGKDAQGI